jgi:hypothetical protein
MECLPAYATAGLFAAVIILDLMNQRDDLAKSHLFLGVLAFLLVYYLCQRNSEVIAWGLLVVPFVLIALGFVIGTGSQKPAPGESPILPGCVGPNAGCDCPRCRRPKPEPVDPSCPVPKPIEPSGCPVPEPIIPAKKECESCSKGVPA